MGRIRKENGKWIVDFRLPRCMARKYGCKRFRRSYAKLAIAKKAHALVSAAIALGDPDGILAKILGKSEIDYSVETFYQRWIDEYCRPRLEPTTVKRYELSFKTINAYCGSMALKDFRRQHLHGYIQSRTGQVSSSTINKDIIAIKKMFAYAAEVGAIEANPITRFPALRVQETALRLPTAEEFRSLVKSMPDPAIAAMVVILGETGIRRSEAINLQWKHVDLRNARLMLEHTKGKRVRSVPLSAYALEKLKGLTRFIHTPYVFCHQISGERWLWPDKAFRAGRRKAGLNWVTFHTLRHMRATLWLHHGADIRTVQEALGHQDIRTTMRYTKLVPDHADKALREAYEKEVKAGEKREEGKA